GDPTRPLNQLLEADLVYVRDVVHPDGISSDRLKHLCLIVHAGYGRFRSRRSLRRPDGAA
ncbi:MAG: hypothetical protein ABWY47_20725, partial [Xanthobacteraceae bacterium]